MTDLNKVLLIGRLVSAPERRTRESGEIVCIMMVGTTSVGTMNENETVYHRVLVFGGLGEKCADTLEIGRLVYIEGMLQPDEWTSKDGVEHKGKVVHATQVSALG